MGSVLALFTLWSSLSATTQHVGKAGGLQILCCQEIAVADYSFTLDALALKPSGFCNVRVNWKFKIQCTPELIYLAATNL